jgi:acetyltransferase-like isoleucine patch superfamily enzyme
MPIVSMIPGSNIRIGERVVLCSDSRFTALGVNHPVILRTLSKNAQIIIGNDCGISGGTICSISKVILGKECLIGANVIITDTDFHSIKPLHRRFNNNPDEIKSAPINVGDNVFIGTGSIILKGVHIGTNSVIGAMSTVCKKIEDNSIYAGVPAILIQSNINDKI